MESSECNKKIWHVESNTETLGTIEKRAEVRMREHRKRRILIKLAVRAPSAVPTYKRDSYGDLMQRMGDLKETKKLPGKWEDDPEGYGQNWIERTKKRTPDEAKEVFSQGAARTGDPAGLTKARKNVLKKHWEWRNSPDNTHGGPGQTAQIRGVQSDLKSVETKLRSSDKKEKDKATTSGTGGYESNLHQMSLPLKKRVKPEGIESDDRMQSIAYKPGDTSKVREKTLKSLKKSTKSVGTVSSKPGKSESSSSSSKSEKSESSSEGTSSKDTSSKDTSSSESSSKSSKPEAKKS